jgi:hypothetical protein
MTGSSVNGKNVDAWRGSTGNYTEEGFQTWSDSWSACAMYSPVPSRALLLAVALLRLVVGPTLGLASPGRGTRARRAWVAEGVGRAVHSPFPITLLAVHGDRFTIGEREADVHDGVESACEAPIGEDRPSLDEPPLVQRSQVVRQEQRREWYSLDARLEGTEPTEGGRGKPIGHVEHFLDSERYGLTTSI